MEIPYGFLSHRLHRRLGPESLVLGVFAMLVLTWAIARAADRYDAWKQDRARSTAGPLAPA